MEKIGDRISYKEHDDFFTIIISGKIDKWKERLMLSWLVLWTICGLVFLYYLGFIESISKDESLVLVIVIIFWLYFEVRIFKAYLWRIKGIEYR